MRHYADIVPLGASVQPLRGTDSIMWTIKFRNGNMKRFKFPIRTTPEGSIDPYGGKPKADMAEIEPDAVLLHARAAFIRRSQPVVTPAELIRNAIGRFFTAGAPGVWPKPFMKGNDNG